ncbi:oligosaccharyl transferase beta subunit [Armillaria borealis]|uniref:Dolichyl-diphosphooligosaccharide--protein glycosyltransferase subunit WBP1 n=1 Tax=Armillaria borealis TaxID=47425 RepID=A0AA39MR98_9AGAR|nr:oligosaccharyl transferase beta subunit [Armillaria borealis]
MLSLCTLLSLLFCLFCLLDAKSSTGNSVLVVLDPAAQNQFSIFFDGLKDSGYELTFRGPKNEAPLLIEDDVASFAHVIVFASDTKNFAKDITPQNLVQLLSLNTNLLIALSPKQTMLSSLAAEGMDPPMSFLSQYPESPLLTPNTPPVWFSGIPFARGNNPLIVPILNAPEESFAADSDSSTDTLADAAEKGGEGVWADLFTDKFANKEISKGVKSGNTQFARDVAAWTFQESLVLRIEDADHHIANTTISKEQYTINDPIVYSAAISRFNPKEDAWEPYSDIKDMQLEFTMLDPHIRTALPPVAGKPGIYSTQFRAPDRHGVFKFVIDYKRKGTAFNLSCHRRHDGYPRFLGAAWPYYAGAISTSVGFFLFSAMWLAGDVRQSKKSKSQKTE